MHSDTVNAVAEFLRLSPEELLERHDNFQQHQLARWQALAPLDSKGLAEYYDDNLYLYELISTPSFGLVRLVHPLLEPGARVLDYGSGIGTHGMHFLRRGHKVTFVDLPSPHFNFVRWYASREGLDADFAEYDKVADQANGSFDAILCFDVLEHVVDWREALALFARLLAPHGKLFLVVSFREFEDHAIHIASRTGLTEDSFRDCLAANGLHEVFSRQRPVPLTHPLEPFRVFARQPDPEARDMASRFQAGDDALHANELALAEQCFLAVLDWNPKDFAAWRQLARVHLEQGRLDDAKITVERALELLADDFSAWELSGEIHLRRGDEGRAASCYLRAVTCWPGGAPGAEVCLAEMLKDDGMFAGVWRDAVSWRDRQIILSILIGHQVFDRAEEVATRLLPDHPPDTYSGYLVHKEYARLQRESGRLDSAIATLRQLIACHPRRPWLHFDLSLCLSARGDYLGALRELDLEESLSPSRATVLFETGMVRSRQGELAMAEQLFAEAATLMPDLPDALAQQGRMLVMLGEFARARQPLEAAAEQRADDANVLLDLARTLHRLGELDAARDTGRRSVALQPKGSEAWYELGTIDMDSGHRVRGLSALNRAYRLDPDAMWPRFSFPVKLVLAILGLPGRFGLSR